MSGPWSGKTPYGPGSDAGANPEGSSGARGSNLKKT